MKSYPFFNQQKSYWCVPACLEAVIKSNRSCDVSQEDIAGILGVGDFGFNGEMGEVGHFLGKYGFSFRHNNPFLNFCEVDDFLESGVVGSLDVIAAYDSFRLRGIYSEAPLKHFSLVLYYDSLEEKIIINNPVKHEWNPVAFDVRDVVNSMVFSEDDRYGFYVIEDL